MMKIATPTIAARLLLGALLLTSAFGVARAASVTTLDFVAAVMPDNDFLRASSVLAISSAGSPRVIAFARREAPGRRRVVDEVSAWAVAARRADRDADLGPSLDMLGRLFGPSDRRIEVTVAPAARAEAGTLRQLTATTGPAFDAIFIASQRAALTHLVGTYVDFIQNGDDETLRALAVHDLPRARSLLAAARGLR